MKDQQWGQRWRRIAEKTEISKDISQVSRPVNHVNLNLICDETLLFWHRVKYSWLMNIPNATSRISKMITARISKITQILLNYFKFLPAILILNSADFELFYLPACHPHAELRWFWTILPSCLPSWGWTYIIVNYFTFLTAIQVQN